MTAAFDRLFIFEMANNHEGDLSHGLAIVREMGRVTRRYNVNAAVKLQYRDLDTFIHPAYRETKTLPHIPRFLRTRLTDQEFRTLVQAVKDEGLVTICTPFDEVSVERLCDHGVEIVKVASCSANDWPLLEKISATRKPIICSIGALTLYQIDNVVSFLTHREAEFALLHNLIERLLDGGTVMLFNATANVKPTQFAEWTWQRFVHDETVSDLRGQSR